MKRTCLVVGVVAAMLAPRLHAQSPPDFSGKWVLASSQPSDALGNALGDKCSITQDASTLRIDTTAFRVRGSGTDTLVELHSPIRTIYSLDGVEHPSQVIQDAAALAPNPRVEMLSVIEESISRATWTGRQLVIMTYSRTKTSMPWQTPYVIRRTERQVLSLGADGTLVVESLVVADPLPSEHEAPSPTPLRSIYKKE